jgi:hypothetical protein
MHLQRPVETTDLMRSICGTYHKGGERVQDENHAWHHIPTGWAHCRCGLVPLDGADDCWCPEHKKRQR